jgi:solute carrier family 25 phosphate transporter 23/24/25/41
LNAQKYCFKYRSNRGKVGLKLQIQGAGNTQYRGVWATLLKVYREEGLRGYFKGNGTNCIRIAPYSAVQFTSYEQIKRLWLAPGETELDTWQRLTAGAIAGTLRHPLSEWQV